MNRDQLFAKDVIAGMTIATDSIEVDPKLQVRRPRALVVATTLEVTTRLYREHVFTDEHVLLVLQHEDGHAYERKIHPERAVQLMAPLGRLELKEQQNAQDQG